MNYTVLVVKEKQTGKEIRIKDFRFDPALHEYKGQVLEDKKEPQAIDLSPLFPQRS